MNVDTTWSSENVFPNHSGDGWAVWKGKSIPCADLSEVRSHLKSWNQTSSLLVGSPGSRIFVPPPSIEELKKYTLSVVKRHTLLGVIAYAMLSAVLIALAVRQPSENWGSIGIVLASVAIAIFLDWKYYLHDSQGLSERVQYFFWLTHDRFVRRGFWIFFAVLSISGTGQLFLNSQYGYEEAIYAYGFFYKSVREGEFWRVVIGPFFHGSLLHFLNNALMLIFLGPTLWPKFGYRCLLFFICGSSVGVVSEMVLGDIKNNACVGVSGGVYTLFGVAILCGILSKDFFPKGWVTLLVGACLTSIVGSVLLSQNSSYISHLAGLVLGAVLAAWCPRKI
jgi:membrane associated rhomboid family serine protease